MDENREKLLVLLRRAVMETVGEEREIAIPFSGGLDSTVLARMAMEYSHPTLYVAGLPESIDVSSAKESSSFLGLLLNIIPLEPIAVRDALPHALKVIGTDDPVTVSFELPLFFVAKRARERLLLSGQGADELFGGYARYTKMDETVLKESMERDVTKLVRGGIETDKRVASSFGRELRCPYLHPSVVQFALSLPTMEKVHGAKRKIILRQVARLLELPENLSDRPKKAAQYGSGIMKILESLARERKMTLRGYLASLHQG